MRWLSIGGAEEQDTIGNDCTLGRAAVCHSERRRRISNFSFCEFVAIFVARFALDAGVVNR